jgi:hypothetical protein
VKTSEWLKRKPRHARQHKPTQFSLAHGAKLAGIGEGLLILWISTERFTPSIELQDGGRELLGWNRYILTEHDVTRLRKIVETGAKVKMEHVNGTNWTVKELAEAWSLSPDTIRELFKAEEGIQKLERPGTRKKRAYVTFTIPEAVADRLKRRMS